MLYEEDSPAEMKQKHIDECYLKLYHLIRAMLFDLLELGMSFYYFFFTFNWVAIFYLVQQLFKCVLFGGIFSLETY